MVEGPEADEGNGLVQCVNEFARPRAAAVEPRNQVRGRGDRAVRARARREARREREAADRTKAGHRELASSTSWRGTNADEQRVDRVDEALRESGHGVVRIYGCPEGRATHLQEQRIAVAEQRSEIEAARPLI